MVGDFLTKYTDFFHSLRFRDKSIILFDFIIPTKWDINDIVIKHGVEINLGASEGNSVLITFITYGEGTLIEKSDKIMNCVDDIIKHNIVKEEKEKLLNVRIEELKNFVTNNDIETIKNIDFNKLKDGHKEIGVVGPGD